MDFKRTLIVAGCAAGSLFGQGRPIDWPSAGADAQRTGWEKADTRITHDNVSDFKLVLKQKLDNGQSGPRATSPPVIIGLLISYKGFKELAFVSGSSNKVWAVDADVDRVFWKRQLEAPASSGPCAAVVPGFPALTPPINFAAGRPRPRPAGPGPAAPSSPRVGGTGFGVSRSVFTVASDGKMHQLNSADGSDQFPPLDFLPANSRAGALTIHDGVLYAATSSACGGAPDAIWAMNLADADPKPVSFKSPSGSFGGSTGFALGLDGTVYAQNSDSLVALSPKDLQPKGAFSAPGMAPITPVVFSWKDREMVVTANKQGALYLIESKDPKTAIAQSAGIGNVWGGLSTWEDSEGTRWIAAPVWGEPHGSMVAFKLEEKDGKPVLTQAWKSQDLDSPLPPVITSGVVFVLSPGKAHATLFALDAATGKQLWSSGNQVSSAATLSGLTVANGRVFFTTTDNTLYGFGVYMER